jgi:hypothetical protein
MNKWHAEIVKKNLGYCPFNTQFRFKKAVSLYCWNIIQSVTTNLIGKWGGGGGSIILSAYSVKDFSTGQ